MSRGWLLIAVVGVIVLGLLVTLAFLRSGVLALPRIPGGVTVAEAGLADLEKMWRADSVLHSKHLSDSLSFDATESLRQAVRGLQSIRAGETERGLSIIQEAVRSDPQNLVLGNLLRMEVFRLKHDWLIKAAKAGELAPQLPDYLEKQPVQFFTLLWEQAPVREVKLQLALAYVDELLLHPALEVKAPASVRSVELLTAILEDTSRQERFYVPALFARGLNYLFRPTNLVWPERIKAPPDAASRDIALAVAVGRKSGAGSARLKARLCLFLGDAYAREGKFNRARSWWQVANNMFPDEKFRTQVFERLRWEDRDVPGKLDSTLAQMLLDFDHPVSDLRFMWE